MPYNNFGQMYQLPQNQMQQSTQGGPQNLQNYLQNMNAGQVAPQSGMMNMNMNQMGMQGQGAQAGFQGFQQNGQMPYGQFGGQLPPMQQAPQQPVQAPAPPQTTQPAPVQAPAAPAAPAGQPAGAPAQAGPGSEMRRVSFPVQMPGGGFGPLSGAQQPQQPQGPQSQLMRPNNTFQPPTQTNQQFQNFQGPQRMQSQLMPMQQQNQVAMSDETQKTAITPGEGEIEEFLNALNAYSYEYKDKQFGAGEYVSPMAQEFEKSKIGKSMVIDTPHGKMVDYGRKAGVELAALAMHNHKLNDLDKKLNMLLKERLNGRR